jgi:hypothetical protein
MTLQHLATFAESKGGKHYRDVCERFGVDPAAHVDDDVMAYQFRLALAVAHQESGTVESEPALDPFEAAREAGQKVRAMTS